MPGRLPSRVVSPGAGLRGRSTEAARPGFRESYDPPPAEFSGGNRVQLLRGGETLFPAMTAVIAQARREVWLATYLFHHDEVADQMADVLAAAAARGVRVRVVVDGFGSKASLQHLKARWKDSGVSLVVFRPVESWRAVFQPGQLRRLHTKLCTVDGQVGFVGGINIIGDMMDLRHGPTDTPRLDYAVALRGPVVEPVAQMARAMWSRAYFGEDWREQVLALARSQRPVERARRLFRAMRIKGRPKALPPPVDDESLPSDPVRAAFIVRDNLSQRRAIERVYLEAFNRARHRIDLASPYFYPGTQFRRSLREAAHRGVRVRLLLQGKIDYRIAGLAARSLYAELLSHGVQIHEYRPAYLHAKVALVDDDWTTVGSSNIDPLSLLLNLEANVVVRDEAFSRELTTQFEEALAMSQEITVPALRRGWWGALQRAAVAWGAYVYLRIAGITGRY